MKIAVLTDSAANLSMDFIEKHKNLFVVPLVISVNGEEFRDQLEITATEIYEQLDHKKIRTSLPMPSDLDKTLSTIIKEGYTHVLVINISSGLSGTYNSFRVALKDVKEIQWHQFDTLTLGGGEGFIVEYALELIDKGVTFDEIPALLQTLRVDDSIAIYTINTLKYLKEGGRIGKVEGTIGNLLRIKPVITVNEAGEYITLSKAFGLKRSLLNMKNILKDKFGDDPIDLIIHFGNNEELAKELGEKLKLALNIKSLRLMMLTPVLGVHTGPDMIAYVAKRVSK